MIKMKNKFTLILGILSLSACQPSFQESVKQVAEDVNQGLVCPQFRSKSFDVLYKYLDTEKKELNLSDFEKELRLDFQKKRSDVVDAKSEGVEKLIQAIINLFKLLNQNEGTTPRDHIQTLIRLEFENQSNDFYISMNEKIKLAHSETDTQARALELNCQPATTPTEPSEPAEPSTPPVPVLPVEQPTAPPIAAPSNPDLPPVLNAPKAPLPVFAARWTFATAYQNCEALELPDMDISTPDVVGVLRTNEHHPDGVGYKRKYASIPDIQKTHYYIRGLSYAPSCFSVKDKPLVYDYGGEPAIQSNSLNFFTDAGTGTTILGIDCSAFVSSAVAVAGMRYSPKVSNKTIFVRQSSGDFVDPVKSNWKCFDRITVKPKVSLMAGDIMAVYGHVVIIDRVGEDPFGIRNIQNATNCVNVSYKNFDFTIMQSSPIKNSIGLGKIIAKDYLGDETKMRTGFEKYGYYACLAKFNNKDYKPALDIAGIIRHKGTPECFDTRVTLARESCIAQCKEFQ